jgi:hypothetical protein
MIEAQDTYAWVMIDPQATTGHTAGDELTGYVDCQGYDYADIKVISDIGSATSVIVGDITIGEGTVSNPSSHTTIDALTVAATQAPTVSNISQSLVDLRGRKRYLSATVRSSTAGDTGIVTVVAVLSRADVHPNSAATAGAAQRNIA